MEKEEEIVNETGMSKIWQFFFLALCCGTIMVTLALVIELAVADSNTTVETFFQLYYPYFTYAFLFIIILFLIFLFIDGFLLAGGIHLKKSR